MFPSALVWNNSHLETSPGCRLALGPRGKLWKTECPMHSQTERTRPKIIIYFTFHHYDIKHSVYTVCAGRVEHLVTQLCSLSGHIQYTSYRTESAAADGLKCCSCFRTFNPPPPRKTWTVSVTREVRVILPLNDSTCGHAASLSQILLQVLNPLTLCQPLSIIS